MIDFMYETSFIDFILQENWVQEDDDGLNVE